MESKNAIEIRNLSKMYKLYNRPLDRLKDSLGLSRKKLYKEHYALKDVSFDIGEGECVGIIGTNGSGKSTAIGCMLALLKYDKGTIQIFGKNMTPDSYDIKKEIGVVMQNVAGFIR